MFKAAVFDMDGLIIDSEPFWREAHVAAVADYGATITEDQVREMAGKRTDEVVRHWRNTYNLQHIPNEILENRVVDRVIKNIRLHGTELPGVSRLMTLCAEHNIPIAIASSSAPNIIQAVLETLKLNHWIAVVRSAKQEKFGKPHPDVFLSTAAKLGVPTNDCIVFEDSINGVRAAKAAGMTCVAVPETGQKANVVFEKEPDLVVPDLEHLTWSTLVQLFESTKPRQKTR